MTAAGAGRRRLFAAVGFALLLNLLGGLSAGLSGPMAAGEWYDQLELPRLQPPGPVFGIAWTILYSLLGVALARLWLAPASAARSRALALFGFQLVLNLAWSPLFFSAHQVLGALVLIAAILVSAVLATVAAGRVDRVAPWLMLPYLVWLGFALGLNWRIWQLNGPLG
jgi:tryptophan-rich sensory protein